MRFTMLDRSHAEMLDGLIATIEANLQDPAWWLPIKIEARENFFNPAWTRFIGVETEAGLVAASGLFLNPFEYGESAKLVELDEATTAEIGRCMTAPDHRGKGLMLEMNKRLVDLARELDRTHLIATVHPKNIASRRSLQKLGMEKHAETVKSGYPRDVYCMGI